MTVNLVAAIFVVVGLGLVAWLLVMVRSGSAMSVTRVEDLEGKIEAVDLIAFRNLIDPNETELLRRELSPEIFRKIQRLRTRAAIAYVISVYRNAGLTIRLAQQLMSSPDERVKQQAHQIQELSIQARVYAIKSLLKLELSLVLPSAAFSVQDVAISYLNVAERIESLCSLTAPLYTSRIAAAFR
jgi:hypothetical protein